MPTKYGFIMDADVIAANITRLTNQLWKLIPMREHEENWQGQLDTVILEIAGLQQIFSLDYLVLLSKLEGLKLVDTDFMLYRTTIFKCISLLREL